MTDATGSIFISYRRSPARKSGDLEALLVRDALRDRGIPTWRDLDDLDSAPTEDELNEVIGSVEIAGAVMLISPEIEKSDLVRKVEAPAIVDRFLRNDGFILQPVLINLDYNDADDILGHSGDFQKISLFNIDRIARPSLDDEDARRIARALLRQRLQAIQKQSPSVPYSVGLFSRRSPFSRGLTLSHDVTPYFTGRDAVPTAYEKIETALHDSAIALAATGNRISVYAHGNAALPLGVLFGAIYSPFVFDLVWKQATPGSEEEAWSISSEVAEISTAIRITKGQPSSENLVLAISVNADVTAAAAESLQAEGTSYRAAISIGLTDGPLQRGCIISPQQGLKIARQAVDSARDQKALLRMKRANLHLFLACPLGLAVLIGQDLNTFGECTVYEYRSDKIPAYMPVHQFKPSNFNYQRF